MSDFVIYENPGNKAARLERENAQLKSENRMLRERLGEQLGELVASQVISGAPALPQQQTFNHGACQVTIGAKPGKRGGTAIPSLEQAAQPGESHVQIYNADAAPAQRAAVARPQVVKRPGLPGGGGSAVFDIASMRPVPVKPTPQPSGDLVDDARQRFALLELDQAPQSQNVGAPDKTSDEQKVG